MSLPSVHSTLESSELREVADAAHALLRAEAGDEGTLEPARQRSLQAARAALEAGHSLAAMAAAESEGRQRARDDLRSELLRKVTRTAKRMQEAIDEHYREVRRAAGVGLSTREIASAAGIAHGTVRAIVSRMDGSAESATEPSDAHSDGARHGQPAPPS
jgi:DNA-binding NarL/FixJ family response regulator